MSMPRIKADLFHFTMPRHMESVEFILRSMFMCPGSDADVYAAAVDLCKLVLS